MLTAMAAHTIPHTTSMASSVLAVVIGVVLMAIGIPTSAWVSAKAYRIRRGEEK